MTTPTDDIAGLSERLREWLGHVHSLKSRLSSRSRSEIFYPGSLAPELLRRSEEMLEEVIEHGREAYDAIDALQARVKELEAERDKWDRRTAYDELKAREFENRATQQRQIDALTIRAEAAESRALRAEQERDKATACCDSYVNENQQLHDRMAKAQQERDDAYERAAKVAEQQAIDFLSPEYASNQPFGSICERFACEQVAAAIRRLAGPEKEKE